MMIRFCVLSVVCFQRQDLKRPLIKIRDMKKIHKFKLDDTYSVVVYVTKSRSNYNRFVTLVETKNEKDILWGITSKDSSKQTYLELARYGLVSFKKQEIFNQI